MTKVNKSTTKNKNVSPKEKSTLTLTKIQQESNKGKEIILYEFSNGETLKINTTFSIQRIEQLLEEYGRNLNIFEKELEQELDNKFIIYYLQFMIIKYFTDLTISNEPKKQLAQFNAIIDTFYFAELVEQAFVKEEIQKVIDMAMKVTATYALMNRLEDTFKDKVGQMELENREIIENAFKNVGKKDSARNVKADV